MKKIYIKKSQNADTRTCDWSKVTKETLLSDSKQHISDVKQGMRKLSVQQENEHGTCPLQLKTRLYEFIICNKNDQEN